VEKAVFLDRDGTLIEERNYLSRPEDIQLFPNVVQALKLLKKNGYKIIIVSNQSGVARGYFTLDEVKYINLELENTFLKLGVSIDATYFCPHHQDGKIPEFTMDCDCRKPKRGMALQAQRDFNLELAQCFMVGDKESDIEFGIGFHSKANVLVTTGYGIKQMTKTKADYVANDILSACKWICNDHI
jgi:D-glycero-D-manno-heptose 1,7-bisphosphate phosphatase